MKALVTGGAGCIGSDLARTLLSRGDEVVVFDNLSSGKTEHISALLGRPGFCFIEGDLLDCGTLAAAVRGADIVYHMAANPDVRFVPGERTDKDLRQNTVATYNLLEAMRTHGVGKLAFASTSAVYGISKTLPISEDQPLRPISLYGATKAGCEALICAFGNLFDMQCWIFRFANVVGSKVRKIGRTVISDFICRLRENPRELRILGNGQQAKSYLLAEECIDAMLYLVEHAGEPLNVHNLGCDDCLPVTRIADMVVEGMRLRDVNYEYTGGEGGWPGDVPRFRLDATRLNGLGWRARHNSEEAVRIAIHSILEGQSAT